MTDEHERSEGPGSDRDSRGWIIVGLVLILAGLLLGARGLGLVSWPFGVVWEVFNKARLGVGVLLVGVLLIVWAQSGRAVPGPRQATKLYRSTKDKWVAGVLGGLAEYFGFDSTLLRLVFMALVLFFNAGGLIVAYIVMAVLVPQSPGALDADRLGAE